MIDKNYAPQEIENKWYAFWMENKFFASKPNPNKEPYSIVIPPPNVTGVLHMGHMLNNTIQDVLIRKARMEGKEACWVPGTDHASIATEAKCSYSTGETKTEESQKTISITSTTPDQSSEESHSSSHNITTTALCTHSNSHISKTPKE